MNAKSESLMRLVALTRENKDIGVILAEYVRKKYKVSDVSAFISGDIPGVTDKNALYDEWANWIENGDFDRFIVDEAPPRQIEPEPEPDIEDILAAEAPSVQKLELVSDAMWSREAREEPTPPDTAGEHDPVLDMLLQQAGEESPEPEDEPPPSTPVIEEAMAEAEMIMEAEPQPAWEVEEDMPETEATMETPMMEAEPEQEEPEPEPEPEPEEDTLTPDDTTPEQATEAPMSEPEEMPRIDEAPTAAPVAASASTPGAIEAAIHAMIQAELEALPKQEPPISEERIREIIREEIRATFKSMFS